MIGGKGTKFRTVYHPKIMSPDEVLFFRLSKTLHTNFRKFINFDYQCQCVEMRPFLDFTKLSRKNLTRLSRSCISISITTGFILQQCHEKNFRPPVSVSAGKKLTFVTANLLFFRKNVSWKLCSKEFCLKKN